MSFPTSGLKGLIRSTVFCLSWLTWRSSQEVIAWPSEAALNRQNGSWTASLLTPTPRELQISAEDPSIVPERLTLSELLPRSYVPALLVSFCSLKRKKEPSGLVCFAVSTGQQQQQQQCVVSMENDRETWSCASAWGPRLRSKWNRSQLVSHSRPSPWCSWNSSHAESYVLSSGQQLEGRAWIDT